MSNEKFYVNVFETLKYKLLRYLVRKTTNKKVKDFSETLVNDTGKILKLYERWSKKV